MSPIEIQPTVPVLTSHSIEGLDTGDPVIERFVALGILYVLPVDKPISFLVEVDGFPKDPGGIVYTQRLSPGEGLDGITLITPDDKELNIELGVQEICLDCVSYIAVKPE